MNVWPWSQLGYLRQELRAARLSCSAEMKRNARLTARIQRLDAACHKHKRQEAGDQAYIDLLEARVDPVELERVRRVMREKAVRA